MKTGAHILGIETSCDETAAAVVTDGRVVRSSIVHSQADDHAPWGGVVPEIAGRGHLEAIVPVASRALEEAETRQRLDQGNQPTRRVEQCGRSDQHPEDPPPIPVAQGPDDADDGQHQWRQAKIQVRFTGVGLDPLDRWIGLQGRCSIDHRRIPLERHHSLRPVPGRDRTELQIMVSPHFGPLAYLSEFPGRQQLYRSQPQAQATGPKQDQA